MWNFLTFIIPNNGVSHDFMVYFADILNSLKNNSWDNKENSKLKYALKICILKHWYHN